MPRVHTKKARKDYPSEGIKKGDTYFSWSFRYGGKHKSLTPPRPSQLTQSKMSAALAAAEGLEDSIKSATTPQDLVDALNQAAEEIKAVAEDYEDSLGNMPTQEGEIAEAMQEKIDGLTEWGDQLESDASDVEAIDGFEEFDSYNAERQGELMTEAREIAEQNTSCPF